MSMTVLQKVYDLKATILGPEKHHEHELRILNRVVRWDKDGISYEGDQRHADVIIEQLKLGDKKPLSSPGAPEIMAEFEKENGMKDKEELYRKAQEEGPDTMY